MVSITIANGTKVTVEDGEIAVNGGCVLLFEHKRTSPHINRSVLRLAYKLSDGERVNRVGEGEDYIVEL